MVTELKGSVVIGTFRVVQPSPQAVLVFSERYIELACLWFQWLGMLGQKDLEPKEFWPAWDANKARVCLSRPPVTPLSHSLFGCSWDAVEIDLSSFDWPGSHYIDQPGLEPAAILLPWPLGYWDLDEKAQRVKGTCH